MLLILVVIVILVVCGNNVGETSLNDNQISINTQEQDNTTGQTKLEDRIPKEITESILRTWPETPASEFEYDYNTSHGGIRVVNYLGNDDIVVIPEEIDGKTVVEVGSYCFANDSSVRGIVLPDTVEKISTLCVNNKCIEMVIAESVQVFGKNCFLNCPKLKAVLMGDNVTTIESLCFNSCISLAELHIPATLTKMSGDADVLAFGVCPNLTIYGEAGSYIETVANEQGIPFVAE